MQFEHDDGMRVTTRRARLDNVDDSGTQQLVDFRGLKNEIPKKVWRPMDFGYFSIPPKDSDGVMVQMGSRADRTLYLDGGHKDYRPKNRPAGSAGIFDQYGDLIQTDKDQYQVTHAKKVVLQLGKGYDAKDAPNYSGPTVSVVFDGNSMTLTFDDTSVTLQSGLVHISAPKVVIESDVHLGSAGGVKAAKLGTIDSGGFTDMLNLAELVKVT